MNNMIKEHFEKFGNKMYLAFSGGKDSCVILNMALKINPNILIIHNPKPETHPDTINFIYKISQNHTIINIPSKQTESFIKANGLKCQIDGSRIYEHNRTNKSNDFIKDGKSINRLEMSPVNKCGLFGICHIYPILHWTDNDVYQYLLDNSIPVSKEYFYELRSYCEINH